MKLIASTLFQGRTITATSQALLREYIEESVQTYYSMIELKTGGERMCVLYCYIIFMNIYPYKFTYGHIHWLPCSLQVLQWNM